MSPFSDNDAKNFAGSNPDEQSTGKVNPLNQDDHGDRFNMDDLDEGEEDEGEADEDNGHGGKFDPKPPVNLQQSIERLDALLLDSVEDEKIRAGMGIRMALGMAQELKYGLPLGTETAELVQGWVLTYGQENVDAAVAIARQFLIKPADMRQALGQRLGLEDET